MSNAGFLFAEDAAIKAWFSEMTVSDDRDASRPVRVFFRYPENETERNYPFTTIELIDIVHAVNRQHSEVKLYASTSTNPADQYVGPNALTYLPSETADMTQFSNMGTMVSTDEFVPVDLLYQVSTYCRSVFHDRQLVSQIMRRLAPFRSRYITVQEDDTRRRLQLLDWITADLLDPEAGYRKRIFRKIYTLQLSAEMTQTDLVSAKRTLSVTTDIIDTNSQYSESVTVP